jgi:hypothetical protein
MANVSLPDWANFKMLIIVDKINYPKPPFLFTADKQKKNQYIELFTIFLKKYTHIFKKKKKKIS